MWVVNYVSRFIFYRRTVSLNSSNFVYFMKIYFDGCSWTKGSELENKYQERFSRIISNQLDTEEFNIALEGGSNDRIIRNLMVEHNIENYDFLVIQMTFPTRTEYWEGKWVKVSGAYHLNRWLYKEKNMKKKEFEGKFREKFKNHKEFWNYYYMHVADQKYFENKERIQYETIKSYCKSKNVPLVLCSINHWSKLDFDVMMDTRDLKKHFYGHPTKEGHQVIANKIMKYIKK